MASSNRHWPSMYRSSLACNLQRPDMNNGVGGKSSLMSSRCEEGRNPEPRPRWNPRPEQIRILEGIFNSGMVSPPRDEIRRIRLQLSEYGPVGDANVFYWFQNRKSRAKHKLRAAGQLQPSGRASLMRASKSSLPAAPAPVTPPRHHLLPAPAVAPTSSSSSSSDRSSGSSSKSVVKPAAVALASSPAAAAIQAGCFLPAPAMDFLTPTPPATLAARQLYYHSQLAPPTPELPSPYPLLQWQQQNPYMLATEYGGLLGAQYAHYAPAPQQSSVSPNVLLGQDCGINMNSTNSKGNVGHGQQYWNNNGGTDVMSGKTDAVSAVIRDDEKARLGSLHYDFGVSTAAPVHAAIAAADAGTAGMLPSAAPINVAAATTSAVLADQLQGLLDFGLIGRTATLVVVARDAVTTCASTMQFSVPAMRLDVTQFGEAAVLLRHPAGEAVLLDESGVTVEPLQQDALYYVLVTGDLLNTMYTE